MRFTITGSARRALPAGVDHHCGGGRRGGRREGEGVADGVDPHRPSRGTLKPSAMGKPSARGPGRSRARAGSIAQERKSCSTSDATRTTSRGGAYRGSRAPAAHPIFFRKK
jgi:hypothetical protein